MRLRLAPPNITKRVASDGIAILVVLVAVLVISVLAAGVLLAQKYLFAVVQKVETQFVQLDVADLCLKTVVGDLLSKSALGQLPVSTTTSTDLTSSASSQVSAFASQINGTSTPGNLGAIAVKNQYAGTTINACTYVFVSQRPVSNNILGGEINKSRSYDSTLSMENVYKVTAISCANTSSPCNAVRTESVFYVGIR